MEFEKELSLKEIMQLSHDLGEMQKNIDMIKELFEISEITTIKKEEMTE